MFQRYLKPKLTASNKQSPKESLKQRLTAVATTPQQVNNNNLFDDISVKEMWQIEAIQLLKKFDNNLETFVNQTVSFNSRFEKVDFSQLHRHILELGALNSKQLKEGIDVLRQVS